MEFSVKQRSGGACCAATSKIEEAVAGVGDLELFLFRWLGKNY